MQEQPEPEIIVRQLESLNDAEDCEELQVKLWPPYEGSAGFCVPIHLLVSQMEIGGIVLGAYLGNGIVGFIFAVQAEDNLGQRYHYSCLAGVHPDLQHRGIMQKLKLKHASIASSQNVNRIVWTYDPLQGPNANLNIKKLGGIVKRYKVNYYGMRAGGSPQNFGLPSDRFLLEWNIPLGGVLVPSNSKHLNLSDLRGSETCALVNSVEINERDLPFIKDFNLNLSSRQLLVEIPDDFELIRKHPSKEDLDIHWRLRTRDIFTTYFSKGYTVVGFLSEKEGPRRRSFYLLEG